MATPVIRSFTLSSTTVAPGGSVTGLLDAFDPDNRAVTVEAKLGDATVRTTLVVSDPLPNPTFTEVTAAGEPVTSPTLTIVADPLDPMRVTITARPV